MAHFFVVEYRDIGTPEGREANRLDHIAYRKELGAALPLAGPLLDDAGNSVGSLVIVAAEDHADAERIATADPFVAAKVLELVSVRPYRIAAMKPPVG